MSVVNSLTRCFVHAATTTASLCLLLAVSGTLSAQTSTPAQEAEVESVRRQENTILLRQRLTQAEEAQKAGDMAAAARLYQEAYSLAQKTGPVGVEKEMQRTVGGLADTQLKLAQKAERDGDLMAAETWVKRVLSVDPKNQAAQNYSRALAKKKESLKGRLPSDEIKALVPEMKEAAAKNGTLVQDGRILMEAGRLDEAEKKLDQAFKQDPSNAAATHYLKLVKEKKFEQQARRRTMTSADKLVEVEEAWNPPTQGALLPKANPFATTNLIYTGTGRQVIQTKLEKIVIDEMKKLEDLPLGAVMAYLNEETRMRDPEKTGINFIISSRVDKPVPQQQLAQQVDPTTGLPVAQTTPMQQPINDLANDVTVRFSSPLRKMSVGAILDAITKVAQAPQNMEFYGLKVSVEEYAVVISQKTRENEQLFTKSFRVDPNTFLQGLESVASISPASEIYNSDNSSSGSGNSGNSSGSYGGGGSSSGGEIPRVFVAGYGGGSYGSGGSYGGGGGMGGGMGGMGGGMGGMGGGMGSMGGMSGVGLTGVTRLTPMSDVQTIVRNFFYQATGINFAGAGYSSGGSYGGGMGGMGGVSPMGNQMQGGMGLNGTDTYNPQQTQLRTIFFNDRTGILFVRATMEELDLIEQAVQALNIAPPQVNLEAKFVEISQEDNKSLGFDWFLGNFLMGGGNVGAQGGTAPSMYGTPTAANPTGIFPGAGGAGTVPSSSSDGLITGGLRNDGNALGSITGILTDPQFRVVIKGLEQRKGVDVMSAPNVTTLSGRQAQIQVTVQRQILASVSASASQNNTASSSTAVSTTTQNYTPLALMQPEAVPLPTGPTLDVIPYVSADGYTIQMTLIPSILDFMGYGNPDIADAAQYEASIQAQSGTARSSIPLPRIMVRQITTSATVWDGQTVVLGGLISDDVRRTRDKVPVLGDIPLLGRLFRSESSGTAKKNLVVFVTAKIIDPAGNRVHTEDNLPYDPATIPTQKTVTTTVTTKEVTAEAPQPAAATAPKK